MKKDKFQLLIVILSIGLMFSLVACDPAVADQPVDEPVITPGGSSTTADATDNCAYPNGLPDPIGQSIANTYTLTYDEVMHWYCDSYTYDDIMIALETSAAVDVPVDDLLSRLDEKTWDEIWVETGFTSSN